MPQVVVMPSGVRLDVEPDESILAAAKRIGLEWPTTCGGKATCGLCVVRVLGDPDDFTGRTDEEQKYLKRKNMRRRTDRPGARIWVNADMRLACQATPVRDSTVEHPDVK